MKKEEIVASELLKIKAVFLNTKELFTWASGIKSPIYCDNRLVISYPTTRTIIENAFVDLIKEVYPDVECIVGTSTAGIPHAAIIADKMNLPMAYVRSKVKDHGRAKNIEGFIAAGQKVVVIEDLLSTGKSSIEVVNILRDNNINVLGIAAIFTYNLQSCKNNLNNAKCEFATLSNFNELIQIAYKTNYITKDDLNTLLEFQKQLDNKVNK